VFNLVRFVRFVRFVRVPDMTVNLPVDEYIGEWVVAVPASQGTPAQKMPVLYVR
jgi:hypothetical protein